MNSLKLKVVQSSGSPIENCEDIEDRINNWLDIQGVQMCSPKDKADDYFNKKKCLTFQEQSSTASSENENDEDEVCSTASSNKSSMLLSINSSPLMKKRLQKQMSLASPCENKFKLKQSFSENYDEQEEEIMRTPLKKSRFVNEKIFNFEDSE